MNEKQYETIIVDTGPVTRFVHNEPEKRNPLTGKFILEFHDALERFQRNQAAVVGVFSATGPVFCAGHNLGYVSGMQEWKSGKKNALDESAWRDQMDFMREMLYFHTWDCRKPLVCAVQGSAHTGGVEFMLMFDVVVAAESAVFDYGTFRITGAGSGNLLVHFAGYRRAAEIYLTGGWFDAARAKEWGLVTAVVPPEKVEEEAMRYAKAIAQMPPENTRLIKQELKVALNRMGARESIWFAGETNILGHLADSEREKQFYEIIKSQGMNAAVKFRDEPFEALGFKHW